MGLGAGGGRRASGGGLRGRVAGGLLGGVRLLAAGAGGGWGGMGGSVGVLRLAYARLGGTHLMQFVYSTSCLT